MATTDAELKTERRLSPHVRGHLLQFDKRSTAKHEPATGVRLLVAAFALEIVRLGAVAWLRPALPLWLLLPLLLGLALLTVPALAGLRLREIGRRSRTSCKSSSSRICCSRSFSPRLSATASRSRAPPRRCGLYSFRTLASASTKRSFIEGWCNSRLSVAGARSPASSSQTCSTPSAPCTGITFPRRYRWQARCSRQSSSSVCSSVSCSPDLAISGSSRFFTQLEMHISWRVWAVWAQVPANNSMQLPALRGRSLC
jgi:hypothetical protein